MDLLDGIRVFVAAVETGSFAGAAGRLGLSNKLVSKYVGQLEDRLGAQLLQRTTRRLGMPAEGERLMARAPDWLGDFDDVASELREDRWRPTGTLRVSAPLTFGEMHVQPVLVRLLRMHPDLTLDLRLSDRFVDLAVEGVDLAIRIGRLADSALIARGPELDIHAIHLRARRVARRTRAFPDFLATDRFGDTIRHPAAP